MQDPIQGGQEPASNPLEGAPVQQPSNEPSPVLEPSNPQGGGQVNLEAQLRGQQAVIDRMQTQLLQTQQMLSRPQSPTQEQNPFDPNSQGQDYWRWEMGNMAKQTATATRQELLGVLEQASLRQQETQWANAHPQVNVESVKAFADQRGIRNLDDALTLMTLPQTQTNIVSNAFQQFQRPQNSAQPLQGTQSGVSQEMQGRFDKDYQEYVSSNGKVYEGWEPARRLAFDTEWRRRDATRALTRG